MKIESKETEFQPITITIETQDELDQLNAMANYCNFPDNSFTQSLFEFTEYYIVKAYEPDDGAVNFLQ